MPACSGPRAGNSGWPPWERGCGHLGGGSWNYPGCVLCVPGVEPGTKGALVTWMLNEHLGETVLGGAKP